MEGYTYLSLSILLSALGQTVFKLYFTHRRAKHLVLAIGSFVVTPFFSYKSMLTLTLDTVYMSTAATIGLVLVLSKFFLGEKIEPVSAWASLLIILGITIYNI